MRPHQAAIAISAPPGKGSPQRTSVRARARRSKRAGHECRSAAGLSVRSSAKPCALGLHRTDVPDRFEVIDQEVLDMTRIGRAAARVAVGLMVAAVGVAPATAGTGAGGGHGSPGGGSTGGRGHGGGSFSSPGPAIASGRALDGLSRGHHHHHHHRFHGEHAYGYYDYDVCAYYYRRAQASGSPFWWRRYEACTDDD
jgi:hypothetical protein